jgi:ATP-dependent Clp protease protease subunit
VGVSGLFYWGTNMPLPTPNEGESKDEFIDRCMDDDNAIEEYPDEEQRRAVCETQWDQGEEDKSMAGLKMIKNKDKSADILIYEDIGESWFGGFSAKAFADELKSLGDVKTLNVFINSPGGDVFDGVSIYNQLRRHRATVNIEIDALAASIASVIAMAGDTVSMAENSLMMIHNPWGLAIGNAEDLRKLADDMDKVRDSSILPAYGRSNLDQEEIIRLMDEETWISAQEALDWGFVDTVTEAKKMAAHIDLNKYNFKHPPESLKKKEEPAAKPADTGKVKEFPKAKEWQRTIAAR